MYVCTTQDICALMEVISSVSRCGGGCGAEAAWRHACARGLRLLLPLVTPPLLAMPTLALRAYRMLRDLDNASQVCICLYVWDKWLNCDKVCVCFNICEENS